MVKKVSLCNELNIAVLAAILSFIIMAPLVDFKVAIFCKLFIAYITLERLNPLVFSDMDFKPAFLRITFPTLFAFKGFIVAVIKLVRF
jgi:hypothetical protein